jgi:hypothetical protein
MFQISDFRLYNVNEIFFVDTFITCSTGKMKYFIFILFTNLDGIFLKYLIKVSHFRVHVEEHESFCNPIGFKLFQWNQLLASVSVIFFEFLISLRKLIE